MGMYPRQTWQCFSLPSKKKSNQIYFSLSFSLSSLTLHLSLSTQCSFGALEFVQILARGGGWSHQCREGDFWTAEIDPQTRMMPFSLSLPQILLILARRRWSVACGFVSMGVCSVGYGQVVWVCCRDLERRDGLSLFWGYEGNMYV